MKKLIIILAMVMSLSGCSLLPRFTFDTPNTVPQSTEKSKAKYKCSGKIDYYEDGRVKSCSKGYYAYDETYNKKERKMTWIERIKSFVNALKGWGFIGFVILLFLCPSLIGLIAGRLIEGTVGVTGAALKSTVRAIKRAKRNGGDFMDELDRAHRDNPKVQKKINELRAQVKDD